MENSTHSVTIECKNCKYIFSFIKKNDEEDAAAHYCIRCGMLLNAQPIFNATKNATDKKANNDKTSAVFIENSPSLVSGHQPDKKSIMFPLGNYQILASIGRGGMGEVFVAYDTICGRRIALKRIRPDLFNISQLHNRFLKEAHVTSQLTHPAIIPIYTIHLEKDQLYYTMPYVQGKTLKQVLRHAKLHKQTLEEENSSSIAALVRIFLTICHAVAYAHSKGVLHRDLKPENIIIGQYGEAMILDWGLAKLIGTKENEDEENDIIDPQNDEAYEKEKQPRRKKQFLSEITRVGKVVGTVAYMAPERAAGLPATYSTDIYSLGVILYQILTLQLPFKRTNLKEFKKRVKKEYLHDPAEVAPYREVPRELSRIVYKCLAPMPEGRYHSLNEMIHDLENYIEGRSEWTQVAELDIKKKEDWEFQENVLIAEHVAITRGRGVSDWVSIMISKQSFAEEIKLDAKVQLGSNCQGIGFLLNIPEAAERQHINDGYCLWLGSKSKKNTRLLKSNVEVIYQPDVFLQHNRWYHVCIEKYGNSLYIYLDDVLQFSFISHLPLTGTHVGLLSRDADFTIEHYKVSVGSLNITVKCLAVPDAFLAHKDYATALNEYRRIGYSFVDRTEGREALFRAGITLLEQAKASSTEAKADHLYDAALQEFEKLHSTPGAPLEYLGKALVYQALNDTEEEIKCFELACRRYANHPLRSLLEEQIVYRMHTCSRNNRKATYSFILLIMRWVPTVAKTQNTTALFHSVQKHWEALYFIKLLNSDCPVKHYDQLFCIKLAFWLAKPYIIGEILDEILQEETPSSVLIGNGLFSLIELGCHEYAKEILEKTKNSINPQNEDNEWKQLISDCNIAIECHEKTPEIALVHFFKCIQTKAMTFENERLLFHILQTALMNKTTKPVHEALKMLSSWDISFITNQYLDIFAIWAAFLDNDMDLAEQLLHKYPVELLSEGSSLLHFFYGCWLSANEGHGIAEIHFNALIEAAYPKILSLLTYDKRGKLSVKLPQFSQAFMWERRHVLHYLALYYLCSGDTVEANKLQRDASEEYIAVH